MVRRAALVLLIILGTLVLLWLAALRLPDAARGSRPAQPSTADQESSYLSMPVAGVSPGTLRDSWGDPRENGLRAHHGTDIPAASMTPVLAAASGVVEKLFQSKAGGTTIYIRAPRRDWIFYYAHLAGYARNIREGQAVKTGDTIGYVGDTGDAGPGNYHLHFGLTRTVAGDQWYQGNDVDPFPYLVRKKSLR